MTRALRLLAVALTAAAVPIIAPGTAHATQACDFWFSHTSGDWTDTAAWFSDATRSTHANRTPVSTDHVCWDDSVTVTLSGIRSDTVASIPGGGHLVMGVGAALTISATDTPSQLVSLQMTSATIHLDGPLTLLEDSSLTDGYVDGSGGSSSRIDADAGLTVGGTTDKMTTLNVTAQTLTIAAAVNISMEANLGITYVTGYTLVLEPGAGVNQDTQLSGANLPTLVARDAFVDDAPDATLTVQLSFDSVTGPIAAGRTLRVADAYFDSDVTFPATSHIDVSGQAHLGGEVRVDGSWTGIGTVEVTYGRLSGTGTIDLPVTVDSYATIAPGGLTSVGTLTVRRLALDGSATVDVAIASPTSTSVIAISGQDNPQVGGGFQIAHVGGFRASPGQVHRVITCSGCSPAGQMSVTGEDDPVVHYAARTVSGGVELVGSSAPSGPAVTSVDTITSSSARVLFAAPTALNGSTVSGYTAVCLPACTSTTVAGPGSLTVSGLAPGQSAVVAVVAHSDHGDSPRGTPGTFRTLATITTPVATGTSPEPAALLVGFTPSTIVGGALSSYTATCTQTSTHKKVTGQGLVSPVRVSGLVSNSGYTCTVRAVTDAGSSAESPPVAGRPGRLPSITATLSRKGAKATIIGVATVGDQKAAKRTVQLTFQPKGSKVRTVVATATTSSKGTYTFHVTLKKAGTFQVQLPVGPALAVAKGLTVKAV